MQNMHLFWPTILHTVSSLRLMEVSRLYFAILFDINLNLIFRSITAFPGGPVDVPVERAAKRLGIAPTQVIFLWVKAKGAVIVTSVKEKCIKPNSVLTYNFIRTSSSKQHLEQYITSGDLRKSI